MTATDGGPSIEKKYVGSLLHGLSILDMFTRDRQTISIGEMALELRLHKSSASRLASTLAHAGYLIPTQVQGTYRLGGRLAALGQLVQESVNILDTVLPHLEALTEVTGETGHLAVTRGTDATTLAITEGWHTIRMHSWVGKTSPAYVSSMGKALLAGMDDSDLADLYRDTTFERMTEHTVANVGQLLDHVHDIRSRGYGFDDEELEVGMRCISAPIVDAAGSIVASISISGPSQRVTLDAVHELQPLVRWHAASASKDLGSLSGVPAGWPDAPPATPPPPSYIPASRRSRSHDGQSGDFRT